LRGSQTLHAEAGLRGIIPSRQNRGEPTGGREPGRQ